MSTDTIQWLLDSNEPWTRYRTLLDLLDAGFEETRVQKARIEMLTHPLVQGLVQSVTAWPGYPLQRHNDARHPIHQFSTLADFGFSANHPAMTATLEALLAHQSTQGAFQVPVNIASAYGGSGQDTWAWMACDAPTLLYILLAMGLGADPRVSRAATHLVSLVEENGWRCAVSPEAGRFRGPGRKTDPCPIANLLALKALALLPEQHNTPAVQLGIEMLLQHWTQRQEKKYYLFGMGTDFRKLKYPFIWYDILHVTDVLSHFATARADARFRQMLEQVFSQADEQGRYTAGSVYLAWKDWSFANKKTPSPWITFLVLRLQKRLCQ